MAIQKEIWVDYIIANLFKNQDFLTKCRREDSNVIAGKIVHIPQAGTKPTVVKNRSSTPAAVVKRADGDIVYVIDEYTTDPVLIPNADIVELSYDKMASVLEEHISALMEAVGDNVIVDWLKGFAAVANQSSLAIVAATQIPTSGAAVAAHLAGATGNRKLFMKEELKKGRTAMNKQNISKENRYALFSSDMLDQLMEDADLKKRDSALELDMRSGSIGRLYGFEFLERSSTATFTNAATKLVKDPGAAAAATDNDSVVLYQKDAVEAALGEVKFFEDLDNPQNYGDVYSGLVRFGGRKRRSNGEGVISIVQEASA